MHKFFAKTEYLGKSVVFLPHCHSTNDIAQELIKKQSPYHGTVVITPNQTNGRGQRGNTWESEPGMNAIFSILLTPEKLKVQDQFYLHIVVTLGIYDALSVLVGDPLSIKWPNDIMFGSKKIGGILIENTLKGSHISSSVIGIGLNVNQKVFSIDSAISISEITKEDIAIDNIIENILVNLESRYNTFCNGDRELLYYQYLRRLYQFGLECQYQHQKEVFSGKIVGVDDRGRLEIESNKKIRVFDFKEVSFVGY